MGSVPPSFPNVRAASHRQGGGTVALHGHKRLRHSHPFKCPLGVGTNRGKFKQYEVTEVHVSSPTTVQQMPIRGCFDGSQNLFSMTFSRPLACFAGSLLLALSGRTAETTAAAVTITNITFRNHVQPVLAKMGCSSGACHGAAAGQNGKKLSLRGYDDEGDYLTLTRNALGRRIIPADPGRSLLLLKPTGAVPHKGGKRFEVDSLEYEVLADWIATGTPGPKKDDPRIERIEILPEHLVLKPAAGQQLIVHAWFSDGHSEDVTRWAKYSAANASVAQVEDNGKVQVVGNGEGAITAWYLSRIAIASVTIPYTNKVSPAAFAKA